jgi:hypothetical protein
VKKKVTEKWIGEINGRGDKRNKWERGRCRKINGGEKDVEK